MLKLAEAVFWVRQIHKTPRGQESRPRNWARAPSLLPRPLARTQSMLCCCRRPHDSQRQGTPPCPRCGADGRLGAGAGGAPAGHPGDGARGGRDGCPGCAPGARHGGPDNGAGPSAGAGGGHVIGTKQRPGTSGMDGRAPWRLTGRWSGDTSRQRQTRHALIGFRGLMLQRGPRIAMHFEGH